MISGASVRLSSVYQQVSALFSATYISLKFLYIRPFGLSVRKYQRSSHWANWREIWYRGHLWKHIQEFQIWLQAGKIIGDLTWRPRYILFLPAMWNRHKSALFEWNIIRLLRYARCYKHYANAPQCDVTRTLPFMFHMYCPRFFERLIQENV